MSSLSQQQENQVQSTSLFIKQIAQSVHAYLSSQSKVQLAEHCIVVYAAYRFLSAIARKGLLRSLTGAIKSTSVGQKAIQSTINAEAEKTVRDLFPQEEQQDGSGSTLSHDQPQLAVIPDEGIDLDNLLEYMKNMKEGDVNPSEGKVWAYIYEKSHEHSDFVSKAHNLFIHTNALSPMAFKSLRRMENEIIAMCKPLFHATTEGMNVVGSVTSGGTESLLLMMKCYRDRARALKPHIIEPEVILCDTAHPAIYKAAHYFNMKLVFVPFDTITMKMDMKATEKAITKNTILLIGSAPQYPHGIIDPITQLSDLALKYQLPLHVDSCIGGFVLPFVEMLGHKIETFDFRLKGVTSISADLHKYGYSPKGASVLLYRDPEIRKYQFYASTSWPGGFYISPTLMGSRGGGPIAAAWASLKAMGMKGFISTTKCVLDVRSYIQSEISKLDDIEILGDPLMSVIAFKSNSVNIFAVADKMEQKGWHIDRQRRPDSIHLTAMPQHAEVKEQFVTDFRESLEYVKQNASEFQTTGTVAMYGMIAKVEKVDSDLLEDFLTAFMDQIYRN